MARFKVGQEVVCIKEGGWTFTKQSEVQINASSEWGPKYGDIVTVSGFPYPNSISLYEWPRSEAGYRASFNELRFEPLQDITELTEILEQQPTEI